jgi:hypothetical protein
MLNLPTEIAETCAPLFAAIPFDQSMPHLLGGNPKETKLVENICSNPIISGRFDLIAGLWLYVDDLKRSHTVSQGIEDETGAYWHGIMHRREGDFWNSHYWITRAAAHPLIQLHPGLDPGSLIDQVQACRGQNNAIVVERQREEWKMLFEWCANLTPSISSVE